MVLPFKNMNVLLCSKKSVLEILNIYQAVGDMHFIGERDYFNKIEKKLEKELETDGGSL